MYDEVRSRPVSIINAVHLSPAKIAPQLEVIAAKANGLSAQPNGHTESVAVGAA
jgi:hypothetical protein